MYVDQQLPAEFRQGVVPVTRVWAWRGVRWVEVGPCPFCGGVHQHTWPIGQDEPGARIAPCTAREPGEYRLSATAELLAREAASGKGRRNRRRARGHREGVRL